MTGKTLRELLPSGSARNKIEFLADELQHGLELLSGLGSSVVNLIHNGDFQASSYMSAFNSHHAFAPKEGAFSTNAFCEQASNGTMMPAGWGGEAIGVDNEFRSSFGVWVDHSSANVLNRDYVMVGLPKHVKSAMVFQGLAYKAVAFAPFTAQRRIVLDPEHGGRPEFVTVTASVRFGTVCKWGVVELNPSTGDIEEVIFCEPFAGSQANHVVLRKDGLTLKANKLYALAFYDIQSEYGNGADGLVIGWAAAFFNDERDPNLFPNVWPRGDAGEFQILSKPTYAELQTGYNVDSQRFTGMTDKRINHATLRVCALDTWDNSYHGQISEVTEAQNGDNVTITMASASSSNSYALCAKLTPYPQRIGFFKADGSSAFDTVVDYQSPYA
ncbi:hypothetical protein C9J03_11965 [Photobacterium gaetbulicola]|uniref:Uncharacterized protein n=1 Tax=Photobacterium gaetbulicola Gung47 TaxID=658445 RepID=A0A0C5WQN1_9GAMM|nr:hypothetical protein [Photobacterium gaetbulicola]AJR08672.1 hypothetical protein H744_2c2008 [Photobacterium gaetbulicola Gung47]PSU10299.1 hypothetical protein C9J03_11965 [Photobacterium gaetbulicola]